MRSTVGFLVVLLLAGCPDGGLPMPPDLAMRQFPMGCSSGAVDSQETDVDCGGPECPPCAAMKTCKLGRDCQSMFCTNNVCDGASCSDLVRNGDEIDVDCGGSCTGCDDGKRCNIGADCKSATCTNGMCAASPCSNMKKDGAETDVDCGGGTCPACEDGKSCAGGADCKGGMCTNAICKSLVMCPAGMGDCDGNAANGCEANLDADVKNCGKCANGCPQNAPTCVVGKCTPAPSVLLVHNAVRFNGKECAPDIQAKLMATGAFTTVDLFDESQGTPGVPQDRSIVRGADLADGRDRRGWPVAARR